MIHIFSSREEAFGRLDDDEVEALGISAIRLTRTELYKSHIVAYKDGNEFVVLKCRCDGVLARRSEEDFLSMLAVWVSRNRHWCNSNMRK